MKKQNELELGDNPILANKIELCQDSNDSNTE